LAEPYHLYDASQYRTYFSLALILHTHSTATNCREMTSELYVLCGQCERIFSGSQLVTAIDGDDEQYTLHQNFDELLGNAEKGCHFCSLVVSDSGIKCRAATESPATQIPHGSIYLKIAKEQLRVPGSLERDNGVLNIKVSSSKIAAVNPQEPFLIAEFLVRDTSSVYDHRTSIHASLSQGNTNSDEHVALARRWIDRCKITHKTHPVTSHNSDIYLHGFFT
jgi:hypothetical protein